MDTLREFNELVTEGVEDALKSLDNNDLGMAFRYGLDDIHEIADQSIPVYYQEVVNVCLDGNLLNEEPEIEGATTPIQMMQYVLYDEALRTAHEAVEEFKDDEKDERERFREFLEESGDDHDDCEEAYCAFRSARDTIESEVYEEEWEDWRADRHET